MAFILGRCCIVCAQGFGNSSACVQLLKQPPSFLLQEEQPAAGNLNVPMQYKNVIEISKVKVNRYCKYIFLSLALTGANVERDFGGHS